MATFAKATFNAASYASFRPTYPKSLFDFIYGYHAQSRRAGWEKVVDLGCGTGQSLVTSFVQPIYISQSGCVGVGQATLVVADKFTEAVGCDPSSGMVENARLAAEQSDVARKPKFLVSSAESLGFLENSSVDMAIAGMCLIRLSAGGFGTKKRKWFGQLKLRIGSTTNRSFLSSHVYSSLVGLWRFGTIMSCELGDSRR